MDQKWMSRSLLTIMLVAMMALMLTTCAKKPFWGSETTGFILNYQLSPNQQWKYEMTSNQNMNMEQMGQAVDIKTALMTNYTIKGGGLNPQKNLLATFTLDTMHIAVTSAMGSNSPDISSIIGKSFQLAFTPKGKELEYTQTEGFEIDFGMMGGGKQNISNNFRSIFPDLPLQPIKIGDSWVTHDTLTIPQGGMEINVKNETTNTLAGKEIINGVECLKFISKSKGTVDGKGERMGMNMTIEGETEGTTTWYFAYKAGSMVQAASEGFMESTIAISGPMNMTMPMTQETKAMVKLVSPVVAK
ncbi:MAG: hypothetical protein ONB16_03030 [candidate division KSB1 bacterium]|nr:hypothetical protein [candidate division KSB1 bacterium]MDZ7318540.1 hypothetical protein [candidate division KSB1 bacterium]MDZ7342307.1 hypothetical protein [candidate division KSB1 bacterium]